MREPREPAGRRPQGSADIGIMEKTMETTTVYRDYIGIMEKKMETTTVYRDYIGILEKKTDVTSSLLFRFGPSSLRRCHACRGPLDVVGHHGVPQLQRRG